MMGISSNNKRHKKEQSQLYKLRNRRKLASLFYLTVKELEKIAKRDDNYRVFTIRENREKPRQVEEPRPHLKQIHRRLFDLLQRIEVPEYLHSGVKGRSYITNAEVHIGSERLLKLDIKRFFPSTLTRHVFDYFRNVMHCSTDVSALLARISTCHGHIPTGSSVSQIMAFYAHYEMFEEINKLARDVGLVMTCYVDDITISGSRLNKRLLFNVKGIINRRGLRSHKEHVYLHGTPREVTGSIVGKDGLRLPNNKHKIIYDELSLILASEDSHDKKVSLNRLIGRVVAAAQSDPSMNKKLKLLYQERKRLLRAIN